MAREQILLVYDGECPACSAYSRLVAVRETVGDLVLVNAREPSPVMDEITAERLDIDGGMVLKVGDQLYYGADALHALALMSSRSGVFNRVNFWFFRSTAISALLYPVLKCGRDLLLKLLGKTRINNLGVGGNGKF